jgi:CRISPR-associated protein Cas2
MMVLILENVSPSLRGELTRWLLEPKAGVFVGSVSALVRDKLWAKARAGMGPGSGATLVYSAPGEQGFEIKTSGRSRRRIVEKEGLQLVQRDHPNREKAERKLNASLPPDLPRRPWPEFAPMVSLPPTPRRKKKLIESLAPDASADMPADTSEPPESEKNEA